MADSRRPFVAGSYYQTFDEKQKFLRRIFDQTAPHYEAIARWGWFGTGETYRYEALKRAGLQPGMRAVDVASGTGAVARALLRHLEDPKLIICVEPSAGMIEESKKTVPSVHHQSTAEAIPEPDQSFDFLTMGFALRHVDDLVATFREFHRVVKDGGIILIMDVTQPDNVVGRVFFKAYFKYILPAFSYLLSGDREAYRLMKYYWDTMEQMTPRHEVAELLREAGFRDVEHKVLLGCFSEYTARR